MAELIMTDKERHSLTFLEWDDEALGKAVKRTAQICADRSGERSLTVVGAAVFLISEAIRSGATNYTISLEGASDGDQELGDWVINLEKKD